MGHLIKIYKSGVDEVIRTGFFSAKSRIGNKEKVTKNEVETRRIFHFYGRVLTSFFRS